MLSPTAIQKILNSYQIAVPGTVATQIAAYSELLFKWNRRISLTSIVDPEEIVRQHFAESILGALIARKFEGRLADVGTGAGFPGLALKIYVPSLSVTLIESNAKKCAFLGEVVRSLRLESVEVLRSRFEDVRRPDTPFDTVTSRALGDIPAFLDWAAKAVGTSGRVMLWVGPEGVKDGLADENWTWHDPYQIPRTKRRFILVGSLKERG